MLFWGVCEIRHKAIPTCQDWCMPAACDFLAFRRTRPVSPSKGRTDRLSSPRLEAVIEPLARDAPIAKLQKDSNVIAYFTAGRKVLNLHGSNADPVHF